MLFVELELVEPEFIELELFEFKMELLAELDFTIEFELGVADLIDEMPDIAVDDEIPRELLFI